MWWRFLSICHPRIVHSADWPVRESTDRELLCRRFVRQPSSSPLTCYSPLIYSNTRYPVDYGRHHHLVIFDTVHCGQQARPLVCRSKCCLNSTVRHAEDRKSFDRDLSVTWRNLINIHRDLAEMRLLVGRWRWWSTCSWRWLVSGR